MGEESTALKFWSKISDKWSKISEHQGKNGQKFL